MNRRGTETTAEDSANSDYDNIAEKMFAIASMPGIAERLKKSSDRADIDELRHGNYPLVKHPRRNAWDVASTYDLNGIAPECRDCPFMRAGRERRRRRGSSSFVLRARFAVKSEETDDCDQNPANVHGSSLSEAKPAISPSMSVIRWLSAYPELSGPDTACCLLVKLDQQEMIDLD